MDPTDKLRALLRKRGYSVTKPRVVTFEALLDAHEALTITQIVKLLPSIDMVSVYRTLELFEKAGIVHRVWTGFKSKIELSETFSPHHHHFTCADCGLTVALESDAVENELHNLEEKHGFLLTHHSVELTGYCTKCRELRSKA